MFLGQALDQFRIYAGAEPPADLMRTVLMDNLGAAAGQGPAPKQ